jgi:hypothetical protein
MAARRWEIDRHRRAALAAMDPMKFSGKIRLRIVVIEAEVCAREIVIYDFDSRRVAARKLRSILSPSSA